MIYWDKCQFCPFIKRFKCITQIGPYHLVTEVTRWQSPFNSSAGIRDEQLSFQATKKRLNCLRKNKVPKGYI